MLRWRAVREPPPTMCPALVSRRSTATGSTAGWTVRPCLPPSPSASLPPPPPAPRPLSPPTRPDKVRCVTEQVRPIWLVVVFAEKKVRPISVYSSQTENLSVYDRWVILYVQPLLQNRSTTNFTFPLQILCSNMIWVIFKCRLMYLILISVAKSGKTSRLYNSCSNWILNLLKY